MKNGFTAYEVFNVKEEYLYKVAFPFKYFEQAEYVAHIYNGLVKVVHLYCGLSLRDKNSFFDIKKDNFYGYYYPSYFGTVKEDSEYYIDFSNFDY